MKIYEASDDQKTKTNVQFNRFFSNWWLLCDFVLFLMLLLFFHFQKKCLSFSILWFSLLLLLFLLLFSLNIYIMFFFSSFQKPKSCRAHNDCVWKHVPTWIFQSNNQHQQQRGKKTQLESEEVAYIQIHIEAI